MAKTVWKFPLSITDHQSIMLPVGARILSVQFQGDQLCLWALVDLDERLVRRRTILIYGTGNPIDSEIEMQYIDSVQDVQLVWHIFEQIM
jgi:hypothetical protein